MPTALLVDGIRTPIGRYAGRLSAVRPDDLAAHGHRSARCPASERGLAGLDDIVLGCANQAGGSVTAGNSAGINDGAAALLIASEWVVGSPGVRQRSPPRRRRE